MTKLNVCEIKTKFIKDIHRHLKSPQTLDDKPAVLDMRAYDRFIHMIEIIDTPRISIFTLFLTIFQQPRLEVEDKITCRTITIFPWDDCGCVISDEYYCRWIKFDEMWKIHDAINSINT